VIRSSAARLGSQSGTSFEENRSFADRAEDAMDRYGPLVFGLDPSGELLLSWGLDDTPDGLERFVDIALETVISTVGIVKPQSAFYERHGWRGLRSLTRLVDSCRSAGVLVVLDAKRGDVGTTSRAYAQAYLGPGAAIRVDAITAAPYLGFESINPFFGLAADSGSCVFVVTRSTNPEGRSIQEASNPSGISVEQQLVADIGDENEKLAPGRIGPIGAVFGPTHFDIRRMNGLFLAPGVGAQGATPDDVGRSFAACPDRVLPSSSRWLLRNGPLPSSMKKAADMLAGELKEALGGT
jgi:orotidine 5'-phosphate decarboxylase subfamily 2